MFQKLPNFVFIVLILGLSSSIKGNNTSANSALRDKTPQPMQDQTFNINNWGIGKLHLLTVQLIYSIVCLFSVESAAEEVNLINVNWV